MRAFCTLALLALPCFGTPAQPPSLGNAIYASAQEAFQDLLDALPEESLKSALSGLKGWKDGVFENHHRGVERVHDTNPALATKIIVAAVHELKKRQATSTNSTAVPPSSTPTPQSSSRVPPPPPSSSSGPTIVVPVTVTTTQNGKTIVSTTTNSQGQSVTSTVTSPAIVVTSTDSAGHVTVQTSAASLHPSSGQILTSTDSQGSTFVTTYTPSAGQISSVKLITTTGSNGKPSTITTYVDPTANPTANGKPGLQNGASKQNNPFTVAAACAGALALFL